MTICREMCQDLMSHCSFHYTRVPIATSVLISYHLLIMLLLLIIVILIKIIIMIIIVIKLKEAIWKFFFFFTISSLRRELSPTRTFK